MQPSEEQRREAFARLQQRYSSWRRLSYEECANDAVRTRLLDLEVKHPRALVTSITVDRKPLLSPGIVRATRSRYTGLSQKDRASGERDDTDD